MKASILIIGNEIISGRTQDTNSSMIAREIHSRRWRIGEVLTIGDDNEQISRALHFLLDSSDVVIVAGGLGPTADDITTAAIARAVSKTTFTDEVVLAHIKSLFSRYNLPWSENNAKQAVFPVGATPIINYAGTTWGFSLEINEKTIFVIPGPPKEAERMLKESVMPMLESAFGEGFSAREVLMARIFGISEARVDEIIKESAISEMGVDIGFYPHFPEILLLISALEEDPLIAKEKIARARAKIENSPVGKHVFSFSGATLEEEIAAILSERKLTLTVAESCSGGLLADRITDVPGSSAYFLSGLVCYSNEAKTKLLGVPASLIETHGAVSEEVAKRMADGARDAAKSDIGIATTGIAGPTGATQGKPIGTVFIAISTATETICRHFAFRWDRRRNKIITTQAALIMLLEHLRA